MTPISEREQRLVDVLRKVRACRDGRGWRISASEAVGPGLTQLLPEIDKALSAYAPGSEQEGGEEAARVVGSVQRLLCDDYATISYGLAKTCRCLSCHVYKIAVDDWEVEGDTLEEAVQAATLRAHAAAPSSPTPAATEGRCKFPVGTRVKKIKGYKFEGFVNGTFPYLDSQGQPDRTKAAFVNVQHHDGWVMHFRETELEVLAAMGEKESGT